MRLRFTKMQGAGNDFVVLDATRAPLDLDAAQLRRLADRRFGVGADQILIVEPSAAPGVDFRYRIFNGASGDEVEQCGNGARCFVRFVRARGLTDKKTLVVETMNRRLELREQADGRVTVDMGAPDFEPLHVPFDTTWLAPRSVESGLPSCGRSSWAKGGAATSRSSRWATRTRCRSSPTSMPRRSRRKGRCSSATRASRAASMPASCRSSRATHAPARVRARRRRDARLRHRRLRRGRRRHPPRFARSERSTSRRAAGG